MLDITKIFPEANAHNTYADIAIKNGNNLVDALGLMKSYIDFPLENRAHKKRMKEFIKQFEVE